MDRRILGLMVVAAIGGAARGAPAQAAAAQPVDGGAGFHLEGKPAVDDVFGDAGDYRRTVDRFIELATQMQNMRDEFARSVQTALNELGARGIVNKKTAAKVSKGHCPA